MSVPSLLKYTIVTERCRKQSPDDCGIHFLRNSYVSNCFSPTFVELGFDDAFGALFNSPDLGDF